MYPVSFRVDHAGDERNRVSVALRYFLALPWLFVAWAWGIAAWVATVVAWFAIVLGRGEYPPALYDFNARYLRMATRAHAFYLLQTDALPPIDGEPDPAYPVHIDVAPAQDTYDRLKVGLRWLYLIPVYIVVWLVSLVGMAAAVVAWFQIVLTGRLSPELEELIAKAMASITRATAYALLLTDRYPPAWDSEPVVGGLPPSGPPMVGVQA